MFSHELVISGRIIKSKRIAISWTAILSLVMVCACAGIVGARRQSSNSQLSQTEKPRATGVISIPLTTLYVSVYDRDGKFVDGLDHDAFNAFEDGQKQRVVIFSQQDSPATLGLLLDTSGSMASKIRATAEAARRFIQVSNPNDKFFAASFGEHVERIASPEELNVLLAKPTVSGRTPMLDALYLGLVELQNTRNARKALLILSDGEDNHSRYSRDDVRKLVKETGAPIYALLLRKEFSGATQEEASDEPDFLAEMCKLSGGRLVEAKSLSQVPDLAAEIGIELKKQYRLSYYPSGGIRRTNDVRWRKIEVKVQSKGVRGPLKVYAPSGYVIGVNGNAL
jgi:Ca-activated chloride channel family protein